MKYALLLIGLMTYSTYSQEIDSVDHKKWSIGLDFTPSYANRWVGSSPLEEKFSDEISAEETFNLSYRFGADFTYRISNKTFLSLGIGYSDRSFKTKRSELNWATSNSEFPTSVFTSFHHQHIDIPVKFNYLFLQKKKLNFYAAAGITTSIFIEYSQKTNVLTNGNWSQKIDNQLVGYDTVLLLGELEFGINYQLSKLFRIKCGLNFQQSLKALNSNLSSKSYLYSGGLTMGVMLTPFNKVN